MKKPGFTIIELMIATGIALALSMLLFAALRQLNRTVPELDALTQLYQKIALTNMQLEKDLSGATAPAEWFWRSAAAKKEEAKKEADQKKQEVDKQKQEKEKKAAAAKQEEPQAPPVKPLEKLFYGTIKDNNFDELTFFTANPLQVYWAGKAGFAKPRLVRVRYLLKPESSKRKTVPSYQLVRQETTDVEYESLSNPDKVKEFVVADGIKSAQVTYIALVPLAQETQKQEKADQGKKAAAEQATKKEIRKTDQWLGQDEKEAQQKQQPLIPQAVEWNISWWDMEKKESITVPIMVRIPSTIREKEQTDLAQDLLSRVKDLFKAIG